MRAFIELMTLAFPSRPSVDSFRSIQEQLTPNFDASAKARTIEKQKVSVVVGKSHNDFLRAKELIETWRVFETPDGTPYPPKEPPKLGQTTINVLKEFGLYFKVACRIIDVVDEEHRYGFTFETLPGHVECGWESFIVSLDAKSQDVVYTVESESSHRFLLLKLGAPVVHWIQRRYKQNSAKRMKELMNLASS